MEDRKLLLAATYCVLLIFLFAIWNLPEDYFDTGTTADGRYLVKIFWSSVALAIGYSVFSKK